MISGCSVQPPGAVPGRTYPRTSTTPYPDYGPAWVAECYGLTVDTMRGDLATEALTFKPGMDTPDEVAISWAMVVGPHDGITEITLIDDGHI